MIVPKGKTLYYGKKVLKAGDTIPQALESKFSKLLKKTEIVDKAIKKETDKK